VTKWPSDAGKRRVIGALRKLGFEVVREKEHIAMIRRNADGTDTMLTLPSHALIKGSTLRTICSQAGISRSAFLDAYFG